MSLKENLRSLSQFVAVVGQAPPDSDLALKAGEIARYYGERIALNTMTDFMLANPDLIGNVKFPDLWEEVLIT